ncbi:hypothetical protein K8I28_04965, partial [bacterium]|nr:hypothetical protein [bacterium]
MNRFQDMLLSNVRFIPAVFLIIFFTTSFSFLRANTLFPTLPPGEFEDVNHQVYAVYPDGRMENIRENKSTLVSETGESLSEVHFFEPGKFTLPELFQQNPELDELVRDIDPGLPAEGDYIGWSAYTEDGERLLVTNRMTDNISVFNVDSMELLATIEVGEYPGGIDVTVDYAVVACAFGNEVYVIDLEDYSIVATFETGEQPWVVHIDDDANRAYISCDIDDVCEVIDLTSMEHVLTIDNFPIGLYSWSFNSEVGRNGFKFTEFVISPDGEMLIAGLSEVGILFISTDDGEVIDTLEQSNCWIVRLSGDGERLLAINRDYPNPPEILQIDLATRTIETSLVIEGYTMSTMDIASNMDGSKVFLGVSNNSSALVDFNDEEFTIYTNTYTPFWLGTSPDHTLAVGGQYRFSIIDFETETILGQWIGNSMAGGIVSPVDMKAAGYDALRHEGIYFYDFENPNNPEYNGTTETG